MTLTVISNENNPRGLRGKCQLFGGISSAMATIFPAKHIGQTTNHKKVCGKDKRGFEKNLKSPHYSHMNYSQTHLFCLEIHSEQKK